MIWATDATRSVYLLVVTVAVAVAIAVTVDAAADNYLSCCLVVVARLIRCFDFWRIRWSWLLLVMACRSLFDDRCWLLVACCVSILDLNLRFDSSSWTSKPFNSTARKNY